VQRSSIVIVTPALAEANNGNWQTARRWARFLSRSSHVTLTGRWQRGDEDLMIALHARRSAVSMAAWRTTHPQRPLALVLTGTDLYRDIDSDPRAQASVAFADALVVLNERGPLRLPREARTRCHVVLQSCGLRRTLPKTRRHLRALMVGHLRDEKDPLTYLRAARRLAARSDILLDHVGSALDPLLGEQASSLARLQPTYRWLGALAHDAVRRRIQSAHVLVHTSRMEGGANVLVEAMRSGTPVIASHVDGNIGLLGEDYAGTFPPGDDATLAAMLQRVRDDPDFLHLLERQAEARAPLFSPAAEAQALHRIVSGLTGRR
jgi:putative glycosyltransferase (TIGR04348 family)